jgi:hypothetical protein
MNNMRSFHNANKSGGKHTGSDTWITPSWIIEKMGIFDLDPCGYLQDGVNPIVKTADNYFTESDNGLNKEWFGNVFVNFPYSQSREWLNKCKYEYLNNKEVKSIVVLCFVRSETKAWQENVKYATGINLINKRVKFLNYLGEERGNGNAPSCLIAFGENAFERIKNIDGILLNVI